MTTIILQFTRIQTALLAGVLMSLYCLTVPGRAAADPSDALYIDANGNVGIGTRMPGAKLDVNGSMRVQDLNVADGVATVSLLSDA